MNFNNALCVDLGLTSDNVEKNVLILGNTEGFFGNVYKKELVLDETNADTVSSNLVYLIQEYQAGSHIVVIGTDKLIKNYYTPLFKWIGKATQKEHTWKSVNINKYAKKHNISEENVNKCYVNILQEINNRRMKYNTIIMNPPYDGNLHLKILEESIRNLDNERSICVNLSPSRWIQDPLASYKSGSDMNHFENTICRHIYDYKNIPAEKAQKIFNADIWTDLGIYYCNKAGGYDYKSISKSEDSEFLEKVILPVVKGSSDSISNHLTPMGVCKFDTPFVRVSNLHGHQGKKDFYEFMTPQESVAFSKESSTCSRTINFGTEQEAKNFFKIIHNPFMKYLCYLTKGDMNVPWRWAPYIGAFKNPRTGEMGYNSEWTAEDLCNFYNLSEESTKRVINYGV